MSPDADDASLGGRKLASKGSWAVADQGLFAGANFAIQILLARSLPVEDYGAFQVAYSVMLAVGSIHGAMFTEPMLVFGSDEYKGNLPAYFGKLVVSTIVLGTLGSAVFLGLGAAMHALSAEQVGNAFLWVSLLVPSTLLMLLTRRMCYVVLRPNSSAVAGAVYLVVSLSTLMVLGRSQALAISTAVVCLSVSSIAASLVVITLRTTPTVRLGWVDDALLERHWDYGRWILVSRLFSWVPENLLYIILPVVGSLSDGALLRALMNLAKPGVHFVRAMGGLLLPLSVRYNRQGQLSSLLLRAAIVLVLLTAPYAFIMGVWGPGFVEMLYAGKYTAESSLLLLVGLVPLAVAVGTVFGAGLRATGQTRAVAVSAGVGALMTVALGIPLSVLFGATGAAISIVGSLAATALCSHRYFRIGRG